MQEVLRGSQIPRLEVIPSGATSYALGEDTIELSGDAGLMLFPWQCRVIKFSMAQMPNPGRRGGPLVFTASTIVVIVGRQNGKGPLGLAVPILTTDGWTTIGEIRPGQYVYGSDGQPTRVVACSEVYEGLDCYEVEFTDGSTYVASAEHLWHVKDTHGGQWGDLRTDHIAARFGASPRPGNGRREYRYRVRCDAMVDTPEADLPIDPYLFGYWLGDGTSTTPVLAVGHEDLDWTRARIEQAGATVTGVALKDHGNAWAVSFRTAKAYSHDGFLGRLRCLGAYGDKHIPEVYLTASIKQRLALLAGLMDSDGSIAMRNRSPQVEFTTSYPRLADTFLRLARSLGIRVSEKRRATTRRDNARFLWTPTFNPFEMPRKASRWQVPVSMRHELMSITDVRRVPSEPVRCIQVAASDGVYLTGRLFTPTHNSILEARQLGGLFVLRRELQLHTAHQYDTSLRHFMRIERLILDTPDLAQRVQKISHSHNEEGIILKPPPTLILGSGARNVRKGHRSELRFKARTSGGGRGFTGDDLYFDECMILKPESISAIVPTKSARPDTQQWYTGSAGDEDSVVLGKLRRRALDALEGIREERRMYFAEWSVDETLGYDREDPASMVPANPSLGLLLDPEEILEDELPSFPRTEEYDRERLGVGRYPADPEEARLIPKALSDALAIPRDSPRYMRPPPGVFALGIAVRPDRSWSSIGVVWRDGDTDVLDVVDRRRGTRWLKRRIRDLRARWGERIVAVVIDDHGPGKNLIEEFEAEDDAGGPVEVNPVGLDEYGDATAALYDDMTEPGEINVAHRGNPALVEAMAGAEPRSVGERWVWKRKGSTDITPLEAVTLGRHGLTAHLAAESAGESVWGFLA